MVRLPIRRPLRREAVAPTSPFSQRVARRPGVGVGGTGVGVGVGGDVGGGGGQRGHRGGHCGGHGQDRHLECRD